LGEILSPTKVSILALLNLLQFQFVLCFMLIYIYEFDKNPKNIAMHAIFLLEMMNSCSVNISLVSSTQLSIFLSMDHLAHIRPP